MATTRHANDRLLTLAIAATEAPIEHPGLRVLDLRVERGLTQTELAAASGTHQSVISGIETGIREPTYRNLRGIAAALDVSILDLIAEA